MTPVTEFFAGAVIRTVHNDHVIELFTTNELLIRIHIINEKMMRIRYGTYQYFLDDFSYAISPSFSPTKTEYVFTEHNGHISIKTSALTCRVSKKDGSIAFYDPYDTLVNKDEKGFHWEYVEETGNNIVKMTKQNFKDELYFGLGDKPTELNLRGKKQNNWGTDCYGYDYGWDPLYKNIPFYYGLHDGIAYGIFFDNSHRTYFDFGHERYNATSFWAMGGEMNYYFMIGPQLMDVTKQYAQLTGTHEMPAMWALGYQQCKWSYYPESEVRDVTTRMRKERIPCDSIYLDIDYMDGFRCFTWDKERFPKPKRMIQDLKKQGFKTVVIIDPGIKIDHHYPVFKEALEKGYFCRRKDGPFATGIVWPGRCYFPDFTRPDVREWWADLYKEFMTDLDIDGVWNDMNEPALFEVESKTLPPDVRFDYDGHPCSHAKAHNIYGMQMVRATQEGVRKHADDKRILTITRSGYSGLQRFSSVWTGDNIASWKHLWIANVQCQRLAVSGVSFVGSDIGGFIGKPSPELFVRWIQLGIFHPFCRVHSSQDDGDQEPWSFGEEALDSFRKAVELRYQLLPYHYTQFYIHHKTGAPVLRPLAWYDQTDFSNLTRDNEFMCGEHILTASVMEPGIASANVYLPSGMWYSYWTNELIQGKRIYQQALTKDVFPLYVKAGAIIPHYPVQQYVGEKDFDEATLKVYFNPYTETSHLYEDRHDGYGYQKGQFRLSTFTTGVKNGRYEITQSKEGVFTPTYTHFLIELIGFVPIKTIIIDGIESKASTKFKVSVDFNKIEILMKV